MITINISNCPYSGLKRKAEYKELHHLVDARTITIVTLVTYYNKEANDTYGSVADAKGITSYLCNLTANDSEYINPATQQYCPANTPGAMLEYDFYVAVMQSGANPFSLIQQSMVNGDQGSDGNGEPIKIYDRKK